jgi:hypothetical protein
MTNLAEQDWRDETERLASDYRAQFGEARRPTTAATEDEQAKAFNELMRQFQVAWRRFAARDWPAASQIMRENLSATAKVARQQDDHQAG